MRVTLIHNPDAGDEKHAAHQLVALLENAGHTVLYRSSKEDFDDALGQPADLAVAAGGDGTIAKVARRLVGSKTPMTIFPLGTANNIASCLGISGEPEELVMRWNGRQAFRYRPGSFDDGGKARRFFEGMGTGLIVEAIRSAHDSAADDGGDDELQRHRERLVKLARTFQAEKWTIETDSETLKGKYLLIEVMRIAAIGPRVSFAPSAAPDSDRLAMVTITEDERDLLVDFLTAHAQGSSEKPPLPVRFVRNVTLRRADGKFHADDKVRDLEKQQLEITTDDESVRVVIPAATAAA